MLEKNFHELNIDQLGKVTGGSGNTTAMKCSVCGHEEVWAGDYSGRSFNCPECGGVDCFIGGTYTPGDGEESSSGGGADVFGSW